MPDVEVVVNAPAWPFSLTTLMVAGSETGCARWNQAIRVGTPEVSAVADRVTASCTTGGAAGPPAPPSRSSWISPVCSR